MKKSESLFNVLLGKRLIGLLAPKSVEECLSAYEVLSSLGIVLEVAFRTETAMEGLKAVLETHPDALILAGTVMTPQQAEKAIESGVAGIVSADYIPEVVRICIAHDLMCIPGGIGDAGKQLVQKAGLYGCDLETLKSQYPYQWCYKLFPASTPGHRYYELAKAWKGPFKGLQVIYTGGISLANLEDLVRFDPEGIFCGSALTKAIGEPERMREEALAWISVLHKVHG